MSLDTKIYICSIFNSIDGEVNCWGQGVPSTFVRFAGCNLRCWRDTGGCDTTYSLTTEKSTVMKVVDIVDRLEHIGCKKVTITGGEPLTQLEGLIALVEELRSMDYSISIETNGSQDFTEVANGLIDCWVVDYKCPSSGMDKEMLPWAHLVHNLCEHDFIKFVIKDREDYEFAKHHSLFSMEPFGINTSNPRIAFSPMDSGVGADQIIKWMLEDKLFHVTFNYQIHKAIWPNSKVEV